MVGNDPVNNTDAYGLFSDKWNDLGLRDPVPLPEEGKNVKLGGLTTLQVFTWQSSNVIPSGESANYKIDIQGVTVGGEYWYSSEVTRRHEFHHTELYNIAGKSFEENVKSIRGCKEVVDCYKSYLRLWRDAYLARGAYESAAWDCAEYGSRFSSACAKKASRKTLADQRWSELKAALAKCSNR